MLGLMQDTQLTLNRILEHASLWHHEREIVTRRVEGPILRSTYGQVHERARRLSKGLLSFGVLLGDRIATLAWNTDRHLEAWFAIMGIGAVCHTLNPRLSPEQLAWIINHAGDRIIFVDRSLVPLLNTILPQCESVQHVIVLADRGSHTNNVCTNSYCSESLIESHGSDVVWGAFGEQTAAGLCYTSGTTGEPKGVLYSHRSNYLHTLVTVQRDVLGLSALDVVLPIVPMFHANAWGLSFSCPAVGAKMVMPGDKMDGGSIYELMETEGVTFSAAVPTVWHMLLQYLKDNGRKLSTLRRVLIGGSAVSEALVRAFHDDYDVEVVHAWGMTEVSPLGSAAAPTPELAALPFEERLPYLLKQGRPPLEVEMKLVDGDGKPQPHDGETNGRLLVKGSFVSRAYYGGAGGRILDEGGFFDTGDIATIDRHGFMQVTDRAKDVIKSGGEWISSIEIENIATAHSKVALAAVIGVHHPKWDERPLLLIQMKPGESTEKEDLFAFLEGKVAKWWMPDDIVFVDAIPLGATGKIDKKEIRRQFIGFQLETSTSVSEGTARASE